ncbi:transcription factor with AP2 domain(s) [Plasmodium cynomolgi strain B]|uniref:Transcription factor with AP2 domain(S) n=1 Tax=Plasmodium cynomolgi (strain B) TaxID=1120755 RepID=K6V1Z0_PLACD|nr:transcription factor with AP2 domain(s) [Plasmodium cynomolgi strain B]GAB69220.1 transcription factor with AP2 domain(s) [Plasmodium cynomolgi strain B]
MNDEMCAKEELSKMEKLKRKGEGDNTDNNDDGEKFTNEGNLPYSNYYEQGNDDEEEEDDEDEDAPYNLGNPVNRNIRTDAVFNEGSVYHRTFNNGYAYVKDLTNLNENARGGMYEKSVRVVEAGNKDGTDFDSNLNESLMKLFSMKCNVQEEKVQDREINSYKKILKNNSNADLSEAVTMYAENASGQNGLGQVSTDELLHKDKQKHCAEMSSGDFVKGYNESSSAYQERGNNGVTHFVEHKKVYDGGSGHFEDPLREKKKHLPKRTMDGAPSCVEYDSGDGNGETLYCVDNGNRSRGSNESVEGTQLMANEEEQYFSSDIAKKILDNMDLVYTLNRETLSGDGANDEGDEFKMGLLSKYNNVNYVKNVIQDLNKLRAEDPSGENGSRVERSMGISFGVNMGSIAEGSEANTNHDENYKKVVSVDINSASDSRSMLIPSGAKMNAVVNKRGNKKQTILTKNKENIVVGDDEEEGNYSKGMYIMHENNSPKVALNSNKISPGHDRTQGGSQVSGSSTSNEANLQKHGECIRKGSSSMNNYDYCSYAVNSTGNPIEFMKSQQKYSSGAGEHKYQVGHNNNSSSSCSNPTYLISGGKMGKNKTESHENNDSYQNDEYPERESNLMSVGHNEEEAAAFSNYNIAMVKKTNKDRENSPNVFSVNSAISNLCGLVQGSNKKNHDTKTGTKLVNINYEGRAVSNNQGGNNYHGMYTKEGIDTRRANEAVQYNCDENYSKEVPPKVNYRGMFSSRIRNVKGEKYSYLKQSNECSNIANVSSDAHVETNGEDGGSYTKKRNELANFEMKDPHRYQGGKSQKEELIDAGNTKGDNIFDEYDERSDVDYSDQQHNHHGQENPSREFRQSGQSRQSHQVDMLRNLPPESSRSGGTRNNAQTRYVHERYSHNSEGEVEEVYEVEAEDNSHVGDDTQELNDDEQKDEQNYCNKWNEHFISALNDVKRKLKQATNKGDYLKSGPSSAPTKDISNVELEVDNFAKKKNGFYMNNYEEICKALFNIKNNSKIDEVTKKKLLNTIESSFFGDKNGCMQLLHEEEGDAMQNELHQMDYVEVLAAQQEVAKGGSKGGSKCGSRNGAKVGTRNSTKRLPKGDLKSGARIVQQSDQRERLGHFTQGENFRRSRKNEFKVQHNSYAIDEMRNANSNDCFDTNSTLQQMMGSHQEHNLGGNPGYAYDESKAHLYEMNGKKDTKNFGAKGRRNKRSKRSMNITDERGREDEALQLGGEGISEKYETYEGARNGMSGVDNGSAVSSANSSAVSSGKNEGNYVDELNSNSISSVTHNSLVQEGLTRGPLGGGTLKRGKRPINYKEENNGHEELKKVATRKGEMAKEMDKYGREVIESVDGRLFLYSNVGRGSNLGSGYAAGAETNGNTEEFASGKFHPDEKKQSAQYVSMKDEPHPSVEANKSVYTKKRTDNDVEDLSLVTVRNEYDEGREMSSNMNKFKSDDIFIKKYDLTNDEKKQKLYLADLMRSNELKQINDNYFKLNSNLPSNLLSTSTSSSYSNENLKGSTNNYSLNDLSSNTLTSKFHLDESIPSNMNMSSQMHRNNYSSYEKKKKKTDKRNLDSLYNNTPTTYATCMNDCNSTTMKLVDQDISNDEIMNHKSKNHILNVKGQNDAEGVKALQNAANNMEYLTKEVIKGNKNIINLNKKMGDNKVHGEKNELLVVSEGTPFSDALSSNPNLPYQLVVDGFDDHSGSLSNRASRTNCANHVSSANRTNCANLTKNNSSANDNAPWEGRINEQVEGAAKEYADRVNEKEQGEAANDSQFDEKILFKSKSHSENGKFLSFFLKRKMSSSLSDHKGADVTHQFPHKMLHPNDVKNENEFLLNRTNSLNLNLGRLSQGQVDYDNMHDEHSGDNSSKNHIYDGMVRVKDEKMCNSNFSDPVSMSEGFGQQLVSGGMVPKGKEEQLEGEAANGAISETVSETVSGTISGVVSGTVGGSATDQAVGLASDAPNEPSNPTGSRTKNEIDISICTLANCPTHNPQGYTKNVSRKGDAQGEGGMMKEENDELKRIPGVYYDKNSQRWFGEHKINGVKCAQSFAVKKHGCEEAKRLAIEWKKARIRGETTKTSRPSVEELRIKYLSMSKNMPKVRGVWFNSTPQRMGWVGQAYKKCKRIERIFSVNKYGFEGARKLAIAFRNSQKPSNEDSDEDSWSKDDKMNIKTGEDNLNNYEYKNEYPESNELPIKNNNSSSSSSNEINPTTMETKDTRINLCRDAILFILHDLETILELNIPMLHKNVNIYKICIKHHLNYLTLIKSEEQIIPYLNIFGDYIQRCILPTDLPYAELYVLIDSLIHNDILPSFDHKENFSEYSMAEDPGIITPSMLL